MGLGLKTKDNHIKILKLNVPINILTNEPVFNRKIFNYYNLERLTNMRRDYRRLHQESWIT